jgi:hypothetical protein
MYMKKCSFLLLIFLSTFLIAQDITFCDSVLKCLHTKRTSTKSTSLYKNNRNGINICIDNSEVCRKEDAGKSTEIISLILEKMSHQELNCKCRTNNDDLPAKIENNWFSIILALLAGLIALYQVRSNTIASSRIKWNEELKKTLSNYYSEALNTAMYCNDWIETDPDDKSKSSKEEKYMNSLSQYNSLCNNVRMQLNSRESEHNRIELILDKIDKILSDDAIQEINVNELESDLKEIVGLSKIIFRKEWRKAKRFFWIFYLK